MKQKELLLFFCVIVGFSNIINKKEKYIITDTEKNL